MLVLELAVALVALADLATLAAPAGLRVERHVGQVCSLDEPQEVELVVENPGRAARSMRLRDDVPDEFSAEPGRVRGQRARAGARPSSPTDSSPRGAAPTCSSRSTPWSPAGWASGAGSRLAAPDRGPGLSRHPPDRAVHDAGAARPAEHDRGCAGRGGWERTTSSSGCATTSRGTIRATSTGGPRPGGAS